MIGENGMSALRARPMTRIYPVLEALEGRLVPAVVLTPVDLDNDGNADDIRIVGDAGKNFVRIQDNGGSTLTVSIDANGDGDYTDKGDLAPTSCNFPGKGVVVEVNLGGGNDVIEYNL